MRRVVPYLMVMAAAIGSMELAWALDFRGARAYILAIVLSMPVALFATFLSPRVWQGGPSERRPPGS